MANRLVELQIKLQNAKSVSDLNEVIKDINKELVNVDTNSESFSRFADIAKKADGQLKNIKEDLRGISSEKQIDSVAKLSGGIAAGFASATVAVSFFGKQTEENLLKVISTATRLNTVVAGIKPILEAVSSTNRKAFAEFITGFKESALGATLFGNATRAALTATGIGLFIVALGTVVGYWDDITDAIGLTNTASEKYFATQQENIEKSKILTQGYNDLLDVQNKLLQIQGESEEAIFNNRRATLLLQIKDAEQLQKLAEERVNTYIKENNLTKDNLKLAQQAASSVGLTNEFVETLKELKKGFDESAKSLVNLKNLLAVLDAEESKFNKDSAKKALEEEKKKSKEIADELKKRAAEAKKLQDQLEKDYAEVTLKSRKELNKLIQKEQDNLYKKLGSVQLTAVKENEQAIFDAVATLAKERERIAKDEARNNLNAQIEYYKNLETLTQDQEAVLRDLQAQRWQAINEDIAKVTPVVQAAQSGLNQIVEAYTAGLQQRIEGINTELDSLNNRFQESVAEQQSLTALLSTARGEQQEQIIASIEEERKKQKLLADERKKLEIERVKNQNKIQDAQWKASLANAIVNGALATVTALNNPYPLNIILAALTAILAGVEIATISSSKPEPIPLPKDKGGYGLAYGYTKALSNTPDYTGEKPSVVTQLHAEEWVGPRWMTKHPVYGSIIQSLEDARQNKSMAIGGFSTDAIPNLVPDPINLAAVNAEMIRTAVEGAVIYTSWTEGREVGSNVDFIESRNSA